jgi:hypothetical protein
MALSFIIYTAAGGQRDYTFNKGYLAESYIKVEVDGVASTQGGAGDDDYAWFDNETVRFNVAPDASQIIDIFRQTQNTSRLVNFSDGSHFDDDTMNRDALQSFYLLQELIDAKDQSLRLNRQLTALTATLAGVVGDVKLDSNNPPNLVKDTFDLRITVDIDSAGVARFVFSKTNTATDVLIVAGATC